MPTLTITTDYTATLADDVILVDTTSGDITLTLPSVHPVGKRYTVKHKAGVIATDPLNIVSNDGDTIDGLLNFPFTVDKQAIILHSDGTNWFIL